MFHSSRAKKFAYQGLFVLFVGFLFCLFLSLSTNKGLLEVNFLNVGQGDAIFIKTPENYKILIDGGPDRTILDKLGSLVRFYDRKIDLVFLTHPHSDHLNGLIEVLKRYKIDSIFYSGMSYNSPNFFQFIRLVQEKRFFLKTIKKGGKIKIGKIEIEILSPSEEEIKNNNDLNDSSLVLKIKYQKASFLLMADAGRAIEEKLIENRTDLKAGFLKIGHQGSKAATSEIFLKEVNPQIAIISVGQNRFNHPHPWILENLENQKIKAFRTDQDGDIKIISDGEKVEVITNNQ